MNSVATTFKKDEVVVLLGAGASVEVGIPHSAMMVEEIEKELHGQWSQFRELYNFVRSAIFYAAGIQGTFGASVNYNIERLVVSLDELARREEHTLYPFIGAWNPRLTQVAGNQFAQVSELRSKIIERLRHEWIEVGDFRKAAYFTGLTRFQKELNFPLHVFSLNYDLCVEKAYESEYREYPERGFDRERLWNPARLDESNQEEVRIYLYKLHGSIDWRGNADGSLTYSDSNSKISPEESRIIFGTTYKLQYVDPFLFLVYQLRRRSLEARLVVTIGYGFADEHINGILSQALRSDRSKKIQAVTWFGSDVTGDLLTERMEKFQQYVEKQLELSPGSDQLVLRVQSAKDFLTSSFTLQAMARLFPQEEALFSVTPSS